MTKDHRLLKNIRSSNRMSRTILLLLATFAIVFAVGCGDSGPVTYPVSGNVTYKGQPVPLGSVAFIPNAAQDNTSAIQAYASIIDGTFKTDAGKGHEGGSYIVKVNGFDGVPIAGGEGMDENGSPLFPEYQMTVDLPEEADEIDIDVPASSR